MGRLRTGRHPHPRGFAEPVFGNSVVGIMARRVADAATVFDTIAGPDHRDPLCVPGADAAPLRERIDRPAAGLRIAYSPRLGL